MRTIRGERGGPSVARETPRNDKIFIGTVQLTPGNYVDLWMTTNTPEKYYDATRDGPRTYEGVHGVGKGGDEVSRTPFRQQSFEYDEFSSPYSAPPGEEDEPYEEIQDEETMDPEEFQRWLDEIDDGEDSPGFQTLDRTSTPTTSPTSESLAQPLQSNSPTQLPQRPWEGSSSHSHSTSHGTKRSKLRPTRR